MNKPQKEKALVIDIVYIEAVIILLWAAICFTRADLLVGLFIKSRSQDTTRAQASFSNWWKSAEQPYKHFGIKHERKFS